MYAKISLRDKSVENIINDELERQRGSIQLIASENYVSADVLMASGCVLTNKYAEGYPGKRYYEGCENADRIEELAIERAREIFKVEYVNVQPFSGTIANIAIYTALLNPNDKILGLDLKSGGHLSHGYRITASGRLYQGFTYSVNEEGFLDYDEIEKIALDIRPNIIVCGYSAYSQIIDFARFREIANKCGALLLADISHISGLVIAGLHPSPTKYADIIMTTTHKTLRGPRGAIIMTNNSDIAKKVDIAVFPGVQGGAAFHTIAAKAIAFGEAATQDFIDYQQNIVKNAHDFCEEFKRLGATVVSNGTKTHLFIVNVLKSYGISGAQAASICKSMGIIVNKNTIPFDTLPPTVSSGVRMGTPAMTTRGFKREEFVKIAQIIHAALSDPENAILHNKLGREVQMLIKAFPLLDYFVTNT